MSRITRITMTGADGARSVHVRAAGLGWPARVALLAAVVLIGIPLAIVALVVLAILLAGVMVRVLALSVSTRARGLFPQRDGRKNVRVIRPD